MSCSAYVGHFSSECADVELTVVLGEMSGRMDWPNLCLPTSQQGRDRLLGATLFGHWIMEKEFGSI